MVRLARNVTDSGGRSGNEFVSASLTSMEDFLVHTIDKDKVCSKWYPVLRFPMYPCLTAALILVPNEIVPQKGGGARGG